MPPPQFSFGLVLLVLVLLCATCSTTALNEEFAKKLDNGLISAKQAVKAIFDEWKVDKYPSFLKACFMHKVGWEMMKLRYQKKIIDAAQSNSKTRFVISFSGSSVTAGHDSHFNASYPVQTGLIMQPVLSLLDVELDSRNVALGNNPCTPYDVCIKYFAGLDADLVQWEQTYFCEGKPIMEQFVRQASFMPSKPIVSYTQSATGTWKKNTCPAPLVPHKVTQEEEGLLKAAPMQLVSEINKAEFHKRFNYLADYTHLYHGAGLQTFVHQNIEGYRCQGPYIPTWPEGAASWHPSVIGHRFRASQQSYFWLLIWIDAIKDLQSMVSHRQLDAIQKDIDLHIDKLHEPVNPPKHHNPFPDEAQCLTDYEPRHVQDSSLKDHVVAGLEGSAASAAGGNGWKFLIYEDLVSHNLVKKSLEHGYLDFKWLLYGNKDSGPLSISINMQKDGPVFLCQTPGIWGKLPKGFDNLWTPIVEVYITYDVPDAGKGFAFDAGKATKYDLFWEKPLEICGQVRTSGAKPNTQAGSHVLTVVPTSASKAIVAWVVTS